MEGGRTTRRYDDHEVAEKLDFLEKHQKYILEKLEGVSFREDNKTLFAEMNKAIAEDGEIIYTSELTSYGEDLTLFNIKIKSKEREDHYITIRILDNPEFDDEEFDFASALDITIDEFFD
jgi:hypothetical protein